MKYLLASIVAAGLMGEVSFAKERKKFDQNCDRHPHDIGCWLAGDGQGNKLNKREEREYPED
tara:strand:- start:224 stop:409 length:186 start_codon:yes stop_codon:yes gene_type:complete